MITDPQALYYGVKVNDQAVLPERQVPPAQRMLLALEPPGPETVAVVQVIEPAARAMEQVVPATERVTAGDSSGPGNFPDTGLPEGVAVLPPAETTPTIPST